MSVLRPKNNQNLHQLHLLKLQKQMQGLKNEMEFVEILAQFWPLPNMAAKVTRMEQKLVSLEQQYRHYAQEAKAS